MKSARGGCVHTKESLEGPFIHKLSQIKHAAVSMEILKASDLNSNICVTTQPFETDTTTQVLTELKWGQI